MSKIAGDVTGDRAGVEQAPSDTRRYGYFVAVVLSVVYTFNFLDRQFLSVLAQPVKADLHLSDTQLGLLTGLMFALFYTFFGIPVARLADRGNRVRLVAAACAIWSLFSAASGLAGNFAGLALARMGVGVGEAGGSPPSYSILSDYFPPEKRTLALAIYSLGVPFGTLFGAASGGWIAAHYGWRAAFFAVGLCGLALAPLVLLLVREPPRGRHDGPGDPSAALRPGMFSAIGTFLATPKLLATACAAGFTAFVGYAFLNWTPAFLMREKGMTLSQIAMYYSLVLGLSMAVGTWASGYVVDKLAPRFPKAYALVPAAGTLLSLPFLFGLIYAPNWQIALAMLAPPSILNISYLAPALAVVQNSVPSNQRGTAGALLLFMLNLIGLGGGPLFVGIMSDHFAPAYGAHALKMAFMTVAPFYLVACGCQLVAAYFMRAESETVLAS